MNPYNPYQAPQQMNEGLSGANDSAQMAILEAMKRTKPWVMFLSILGFIGAAGLVLMGIVVMVAGSAMSALARGGMPPGVGAALGFVYIVIGGIYVVPSMLLWRYASSITQMSLLGGSIDSLAAAVKAQASFWRFVGIMTAIIMGLYVVIIVFAVLAAAIAAASH